MPRDLNYKKALATQIKQNFLGNESDEMSKEALSVIAVDYSGLSVKELETLRNNAREKGIILHVARNRITKRVIESTQWEVLTDQLKGPIMLAFSYNSPGDAAKILKDFMTSCDNLQVRAICLDGDLLSGSALAEVAKLPNKEEAIAMLMAALMSPASKLAMSLHDSYARLVRVMGQVAQERSK